MHFKISSVAAVTALVTLVNAQSSFTQNFTITFSRAELDTCGSANQGEGLAFSTRNIPDRFTCFDFDDIFGQEVTSGYRNQTGRALSWVVRNGEVYDPAANYSRILYQQVNGTVEEGANAARSLNVYNGRACIQTGDSTTRTIEPWFGWSCQSSADGICYNLPYGAQSFSINTGPAADGGGGCTTFAQNGDAVRPSSRKVAFVAAIMTTLLFLTWG